MNIKCSKCGEEVDHEAYRLDEKIILCRKCTPFIKYKLCYYDGKFLWFSTKEPTGVWGDDWDDAPYEHNAGNPYSEYGPFKKIAFDGIYLMQPCEHFSNSPYSIQDINKGAVAWLYSPKSTSKRIIIKAGITYEECIKELESAGATVYTTSKQENFNKSKFWDWMKEKRYTEYKGKINNGEIHLNEEGITIIAENAAYNTVEFPKQMLVGYMLEYFYEYDSDNMDEKLKKEKGLK